jgi:hypothetical protein
LRQGVYHESYGMLVITSIFQRVKAVEIDARWVNDTWEYERRIASDPLTRRNVHRKYSTCIAKSPNHTFQRFNCDFRM